MISRHQFHQHPALQLIAAAMISGMAAATVAHGQLVVQESALTDSASSGHSEYAAAGAELTDLNRLQSGQNGAIEPAANNSVLTITPPTGILSSTQKFDLALILESNYFQLTGGRALLDGADVTGALLACTGIRIGTTLPLGASVRCPGLSAWELGTGYHSFRVELYFADGTRLSDRVTWHVREGRE